MSYFSKRVFAILLICAVLLSSTACRNTSGGDVEKDAGGKTEATPEVSGADEEDPQGAVLISLNTLAENLKEEFANQETVTYMEPLLNLPRDHEFVFELEFYIEYRDVSDIFGVFMDMELNEPIDIHWRIDHHSSANLDIPKGHTRVTIRPGYHPVHVVDGQILDKEANAYVFLEETGEHFLHVTEPYTNWGYLNNFYLVQWVDAYGNKLQLPQVTIFSIENQLEAPQSEFYITEEGYGAFRWNPVEGADYYLITYYYNREDASSIWMKPIAKVTDTFWVHPEEDYYYGRLMNMEFRQYESTPGRNYCVIAVNSQAHSPMGTIHYGEEIAPRLPGSWDRNTDPVDTMFVFPEESSGDISEGVQMLLFRDSSLVPTHRPIEVVNGSTVYRRMIYDFDSAEFQEISFAYWDWGYEYETGEIRGYWESESSLRIPFIIEGTTFGGVVVVDTDAESYEADLEAIIQKVEDAAPRGGLTEVGFTEDRETGFGVDDPDADDPGAAPDLESEEDTSRQILIHPDDKVYANSALSAFLAWNMLACNDLIDLSRFPESANHDLLADAFFEAMYQNPLILHVDGAEIVAKKNALRVYYRESAETISRQQDEIRQVVPEIVTAIIDSDMSDLEKSIAINSYLIETSEYDWEALENAAENNFIAVDPRFNDTFTAYGILINKVGVCAGYAAAYKLLADEAGLDVIVITGFLDGFLPHAWNRVYIDGHWSIVDVTNNANEFIPNVILHLPDVAVSHALVEDKSYLLDDFLSYHRSSSDNAEYYRLIDSFYMVDVIAAELAEEVRANGSATLRTDYELDDAMFTSIVMEVMDLLDTDELYGTYWLGVIWIGS